MDCWWKNPNHVRQIVDWAYELNSQFPDARLIALGQSPAWIIRSVAMLRKMNGQGANVAYVPFTGGFLQRDRDRECNLDRVMRFRKRAGWNGNGEIQRYLDYLKLINAHPDQVAEELKDGKRIVFSEMIKASNGLASFLNFYFSNASEQNKSLLKSGAEFFVYDTAPGANKDYIELEDDCAVPLQRHALSFDNGELLSSTASLNVAEETSSRLVPMYRLMAHGTQHKGLTFIPNQDVRKKIEQVLHTEIQRREHNPELTV